jgi:hydroxymethylglutaryl-CoA lyase
MSKRLLDLGCYEVSIADTIGTANPIMIVDTIEAIKRILPIKQIAIHLHDPHVFAILNLTTALLNGVEIIDCATGNIGGCPVAKDPGSNISSEDVVKLLSMFGVDHKIKIDKLHESAIYINKELY